MNSYPVTNAIINGPKCSDLVKLCYFNAEPVACQKNTGFTFLVANYSIWLNNKKERLIFPVS